jgi:hypothetical protein
MISWMTILFAVALYFIGNSVGKWLFKENTLVEQRRTAAGIVASVLERFGLKKIAAIFRDYSTGNYSGFFNGLIRLSERLSTEGEDALIADLTEAFNRMLEQMLLDPKERAYLQGRLDATKPAATAAAASADVSPASPAPIVA